MNCPFCLDKKYLNQSLTTDIYPNSFIIYETTNFLVAPDIAPLIEGHLLLFPKAHYISVGNLIAEHFSEFTDVKNYILHLFLNRYSRPVFFEHGAAKTQKAGNSIDHAHLHCLPADIDLVSNQNVPWIAINSLLDLTKFYENNIPYIYFEDCSGNMFVSLLHDERKDLPSQFLRKVVANILGSENWNWREMITNANYKEINRSKVINSVEKLK